MKPLFVLIAVFVLALIMTKFISGHLQLHLAGRIAMSAMLLFTAIGHFAFTNGMAMMLPSAIPCKTAVIYLTGIIEIVAAAGLLFPGAQTISAYLLIAFFVLVLPANIYAAMKNIDYQTGIANGPGLTYLWFRIPLQLFFIGWTYFSAIDQHLIFNHNT